MISSIKNIFQNRKYTILKDLWNQKFLLFGLTQILLLGTRKVGIEIFSLSIQHKLYNRLRKKYVSIAKGIISSDKEYSQSQSKTSNIVWICWWQGIENAPEIVKRCITSVKKNLTDWEVKIITATNYAEYVEFPNDILNKWEVGTISNTHMSDLLRLELLIRHGGLWVDSTILCTGGKIPSSILNSKLFFYQSLMPGKKGQAVPLSNWLIYAQTNNPILRLTRDLLYYVWRKDGKLVNYFMFHYLMQIANEVYINDYNKIPKFDNSIPHILQYNLFNQFDNSYWNDLCDLSCFHKLTYKITEEQKKGSKGSYYEFILNDL